MTPEQIQEHNAKIREINEMTPAALDALFRAGKCPNPVHLLIGVPLGMFHCELCGTMVIAGMPHLPMDPPWDPEISRPAKDWYEDHPELLGS